MVAASKPLAIIQRHVPLDIAKYGMPKSFTNVLPGVQNVFSSFLDSAVRPVSYLCKNWGSLFSPSIGEVSLYLRLLLYTRMFLHLLIN